MKTVHYVNKYKLFLGTKFNHNQFSIDFGNEFLSVLELYKTRSNWSHDKFFEVVDTMEKKWNVINNKTLGNLPEKLWNYIYFAIFLPTKDVEFPDIAKQEKRIDEMNIYQLKQFIKNCFGEERNYEKFYVDDSAMEWDHYANESSIGDFTIRQNPYLNKLEKLIEKENYIVGYAFDELVYQLSKVAYAKAKIQFNIYHNQKKREHFDWREFAFKNMFGIFNSSEYDAYFDFLKLDMNSSEEDVQKNFRLLSMKYHPDKGGSNEQFIELTEAKNKCIEYISIKKRNL